MYLRGGVSVSGATTWYPNRLEANHSVNAGAVWQTLVTQFLGWNGATTSALFMGTSGKFIGFRFNSGGIKYGWIRLDVAANGASITLVDWAYQDDGSAILTGDTGTPAPIELISFKARQLGGIVNLDWKTASEQNFSGFSLERAEENESFSEIGWISGKGNTEDEQEYRFDDKAAIPNKRYYYRLKAIDLDGSFEYSHIVEATLSGFGFTIEGPYPNPITSTPFKLDIMVSEAETVFIRLFSASGQMVYESRTPLVEGRNEVLISDASLSSGIYFLKIQGRYYHNYKKLEIIR